MKKKSTLGRVLQYIGKYKFLLPVSILLAIISVFLTLYIPILVGDAITVIEEIIPAIGENANSEIQSANVERIGKIVGILLGAAILVGVGAIVQWLMSTLNNRIAYSVAKDVRSDAFGKLKRLPLSYLDTHPHGDILSRTITDTEQFSEGLLLGFTQLFTGILTILGTMVMLFILSWQVALVVVLLTPLSLFAARFISKRTYNMFREQSSAKGVQTALINEMCTNEKLVIALGYGNRANERFFDANKKLEKASLRAIFFSSLVNPVTRFVNSVVYAAVALVSALLYINGGGEGAITVGTISVLLSYANQYTKPFNEISGVITEFQNSLASAGRVFELIDEKEETSDEGLLEVGKLGGTVELNNVSFSYVPETPLIENVSLTANEGKRIAIVGPTGCGKTTLINLLMRFYDVNGGYISVDGHKITDITRHSLRDNYGMVLQDTWLKSGTIRDNIVIGKPDATDEEIVAAARAAHSHSFIKRLPSGYDTDIGEGGYELSAGQRQLLCITRIMLSPPPILILDEATSSIDTRTEMKIQDAFLELMRGRTSFIVAHRLSTIKEADTILVMKDGNIIEQGSHDELLAQGGFYSELYNSQFAH